MKFIISGGTGFIGRRIVSRLLADGHYVGVWSRRPGNETRIAVASHSWDPLVGEPPSESLNGMDTVIHLAGESVAQRWNAEVRKKIRDSRVLGTHRLVDSIARVQHPPRALVSASAVGYYGDRGAEILQENATPGNGFLAEVCQEWEAEARRATQLGLRVVSLRIGFVLGNDGGALQPMTPVFRAGLGGRLGSGRQFVPWIHVDDVAAMFCYAALNEVSGVWNCTAPNPAMNAEFTAALAKVLHRPALFPVPEFALRLLFGELGRYMLDSARAVPGAALRNGFNFTYPELLPALDSLLR
jgi:uncharacterized protein (TIGR01777 family)